MKLANGSGSIVCLDKTGKKRRKPWAVRITTGWKNGRQVRKYIGYYATQSEAIIALAEYHKNGIDVDVSKMTLQEVFDVWFKRVEKKGLSPSVIRGHKMVEARFGKLGSMLMKEIKLAHLQRWMDDIELKPGSKVRMRNTMSQIFDYAVDNDIIVKNYAKSIEINEKTEKVGAVFTEEEIALLWQHKDDRTARRLLILIYTGLRIGELLDINRDSIFLDKGYMVGGSKTEAGRDRVIPIHNKILPLVREELGDNYWLIQNKKGNATQYTSIRVQIYTLFEKFNMEHKIHDTRKTAISLMHSGGIPIETVRMIVGHSGKGVTEKVYLYKNPEELVEVINTLDIPYVS